MKHYSPQYIRMVYGIPTITLAEHESIVKQYKKALQAFVDACDSGADPEENFLDEYLQALDIISKVKRE